MIATSHLSLQWLIKSSSSPRDGRTSQFDAMAAESRRRPSNKVAEASVVVTAASEVEPLAHPDPVEAWEVVQEEMLAVSLHTSSFLPFTLFMI